MDARLRRGHDRVARDLVAGGEDVNPILQSGIEILFPLMVLLLVKGPLENSQPRAIPSCVFVIMLPVTAAVAQHTAVPIASKTLGVAKVACG